MDCGVLIDDTGCVSSNSPFYRSFTVRSTLTAHMRTHSGVKGFKCDICEKMFATHGSLNIHMRLHTGMSDLNLI